MEAAFIHLSKAPYGAPVLFYNKQDWSLWLCIDYRALNKLTVKNHNPISLISDLLDQLNRAMYLSKLDFRSGYHQVYIGQGDKPKTVCMARYGAFQILDDL